jgi:hypothetical protein
MNAESTALARFSEAHLSLEEGTACRIIRGAVMASPVSMTRRLLVMRTVAESLYGTLAMPESLADGTPTNEAVTAAYELAKLNSVGAAEALRSAEGGALSSDNFAKMLGISNETVRSYQKSNRLIAWRKDRKNLRFPAWQIHNGSILAGLEEVLECAKRKDWSPEEVISFFLTPCDVLKGQRPLDLLRRGEVEPVLRAARQEGDIGA